MYAYTHVADVCITYASRTCICICVGGSAAPNLILSCAPWPRPPCSPQAQVTYLHADSGGESVAGGKSHTPAGAPPGQRYRCAGPADSGRPRYIRASMHREPQHTAWARLPPGPLLSYPDPADSGWNERRCCHCYNRASRHREPPRTAAPPAMGSPPHTVCRALALVLL